MSLPPNSDDDDADVDSWGFPSGSVMRKFVRLPTTLRASTLPHFLNVLMDDR